MKIPDFEYYHGVVIRRIVVEHQQPVLILPFDFSGRVDSFRIGENAAIHIRHSTKRLPPWTFTINSDALRELIEIRKKVTGVFLVLVCGEDGIVTLGLQEFVSISEMRPGGAVPLRVSRNRNQMYTVTGNKGELERKKGSGLGDLLAAL